MIEHHFIIKYSKEGGWEWDTDTEEARYPDGTVFNDVSEEWSSGYIGWSEEKGEGEYLDDDDFIGQQLSALLEIANSERGGEVMDTLFKGKCDTCEREYLPTNMSMCNECANEEENK